MKTFNKSNFYMKKIFLLLLAFILTDFASAQMSYVSVKKHFENSFIQSDELNSANEQMKRRRGRSRGRRGKGSNFAIGGSITTMKLFESIFDTKLRIGFGGNAWYNFTQSSSIRGGIYYFVPIINSFADAKNTTSYLQMNAHFQQFLAGNNKEDFGFYAFGGFGYIINFNKTESEAVDINARYTNINLDLGIGAQFNLNFAFLFAEAQASVGLLKFEIPTNPADGINVPSFMNFKAGMKFPLNF